MKSWLGGLRNLVSFIFWVAFIHSQWLLRLLLICLGKLASPVNSLPLKSVPYNLTYMFSMENPGVQLITYSAYYVGQYSQAQNKRVL